MKFVLLEQEWQFKLIDISNLTFLKLKSVKGEELQALLAPQLLTKLIWVMI